MKKYNPNKIQKDLPLKDFQINPNIKHFYHIEDQIIQQKQSKSQSTQDSPSETYLIRTKQKKSALIICYLCMITSANFDSKIFSNKDLGNIKTIARNHFGWRFANSKSNQSTNNIIQLLQINIDTIISNFEMISKIFSDIPESTIVQQIKMVDKRINISVDSLKDEFTIFTIEDAGNTKSQQKIGVFRVQQNSYLVGGIFTREKPKPKKVQTDGNQTNDKDTHPEIKNYKNDSQQNKQRSYFRMRIILGVLFLILALLLLNHKSIVKIIRKIKNKLYIQ